MTYSHMGEPHYHWRIGVSLLSSGRDQVGPTKLLSSAKGIQLRNESIILKFKKMELYQAVGE